jgi:hypothetical protein
MKTTIWPILSLLPAMLGISALGNGATPSTQVLEAIDKQEIPLSKIKM